MATAWYHYQDLRIVMKESNHWYELDKSSGLPVAKTDRCQWVKKIKHPQVRMARTERELRRESLIM
jgi:hypothetical protein